MVPDREQLETRIGYRFDNPELLKQALTHRSAGKVHNERLEFLGDAILDLVIAQMLFDRFPEATEGQLSRMRANLVNGEVLAQIANGIELGSFLELGAGERKSGGKRRVSILANSVEALVAAIFLDRGLTEVSTLVERLFRDRLAGEIGTTSKDSKTRLQELLQGKALSLPSYKITEISGDPHDQTFVVACHVELLREPQLGRGKSKRMAEQDAASRALTALEDHQ